MATDNIPSTSPASRHADGSVLASQGEKAAFLDIKSAYTGGAAAYPRHSNLRRSSHALQLFGLLFVITLLLLGALLVGLYSFYESKIEPKLQGLTAGTSAPKSESPGNASPGVPVAVKIDLPQEYKDQLSAASEKITDLQKQIDFLRDANHAVDGKLGEISEKLSKPAPAPSLVAPVEPTLATEGKTEVAAVVPVQSSSNQELVLIKERNRLTGYADEAISTGARKSLNLLIEKLQDPKMANLRHAAYSEVQRVYYHLRFTSRIDPNFRIPVNDLFKDTAIRDESDLKTEQIIKLLHDTEKPWEVRLRAAWLLGGRRTREVGEALIKSIKEDSMLDVSKEAQLSFEQNMDHKFLLLDVPAIDAWWKSQTESKTEEERKDDKKQTENPALPKK
jgi:hypothetical protein